MKFAGLCPNTANATFTLGDDDALQFDVLTVTGEEEISRLFRFEITVCAERDLADQIDEDTFAGQRATLRLHPDHRQERREIRGLISSADYAGVGHSHIYFRLTLSPHAWSLTQRVNSRIFQEVNTPEIIRRVLADHGLDGPALAFALREEYTERDYCVQYSESDWDFISRLMEEEGMYWFYREHGRRMRLYITDGRHGHPDLEFGSDVQFRAPEGRTPAPGTIYEFTARRQLRPGQVAMADYAAVKPSMPLDVGAQDASHPTEESLEVFQYPGEFRTRQLGGRLARVRLEEARCGRRRGSGRSTRVDFAPGRRFVMTGHVIRRANIEYVITRVKHYCVTPMAEQIGYTGNGRWNGEPLRPAYENEFDVMPHEDAFRPARVTPRPRVAGPQTAVVVGPKEEEIYTDRYGRVKVRFRWDRSQQLAHDARTESDASCWIRVSQPWAGAGYGGLAIPRIGQEVIVDFLEGDPDQPVITGRLYNGESMQPTSMSAPTRATAKGPEPIPAMQNRPQVLPESKARTTIRSNSTPGGGGANEISMDDSAKNELLYFNATKDLVTTVGNDSTMTIGNDRKTSVGANSEEFVGVNRERHVGADENINVEANRSHTVKGNEVHTVHMCRSQQVSISENNLTGVSKTVETGIAHVETIGMLHALLVGLNRVGVVGGNDTLTVGADRSESVGRTATMTQGLDLLVSAGANIGMKAGGMMVLESPDVTLKGTGGFIRIDDEGVTIKGKMVKINSSGGAPGELPADRSVPAIPGGAEAGDGAGVTGVAGSSGSGLSGSGGAVGLGDLGGILNGAGGLLDQLGIPADGLLGKALGKVGDLLPRIPGLPSEVADLLKTVLNNKLPNADQILSAVKDQLPEDARKAMEAIKNAIDLVQDPPILDGPRPQGFPKTAPGAFEFWREDNAARPDDSDANTATAQGDESAVVAKPNVNSEEAEAIASQTALSEPNRPPRDYHDLAAFAHQHGFTVTSTTGGKHNPGSAHYEGRAIDVRTRDKTDAEIEAFIVEAQRRGIRVRDERTKPNGQKVWSGPHLHLELPRK